MLDISLNEAVYTVAAGSLFLAGIAAILYIFHLRWFSQLHTTLSNSSSWTRWLSLVAAVILSFLSGIAAENISDVLSDDLQLYPFGESMVRTATLFSGDGTLKALGRELYDNGSLQEHKLDYSTDQDAVVASLYYRAKNTVYRHENYFAELSLIQARIDFARSLTFISLIIVIAAILKGASSTIGDPTADDPTTDDIARRAKKVLQRAMPVGLFCMAYAVVGGVGLSSFVSEEQKFNERVFGYYSTLQDRETSDQQRVSEDSPKWPVPLSGIVKWDDDHYVVVSDEKTNTRPRIYNLEIDLGSQRIYPAVVKWGKLNSYKPTDIESICSTPDAFWILESGHYPVPGDPEPLNGAGRSGRLIKLVRSEQRGIQLAYVRHYKLPADVDNIEGMHCWLGEDKRPLFLVAERGGSVQAKLRVWRIVDNKIFEQKQYDVPILETLAEMSPTGDARWISGLTGQPRSERELTLWATGAVEEESTLASVIYRVGVVATTDNNVSVTFSLALCAEMPDDKFEGVTMSGNPGEFVMVSDNEVRGGGVSVLGDCPATWN